MENSIHQSKTIYNYLKNLNLGSVFSHTVIKHILSILISVFSMGYNGKTVDFENTVLVTVLSLPIFLITENGMTANFRMLSNLL